MSKKGLCAAALLTAFCATAALADGPAPAGAAPEKTEEAFSVMRTILYLPFKSVVCIVGATASFPVYWLSGFDPQVKNDTAALRAQYCSLDYLLGSKWTK